MRNTFYHNASGLPDDRQITTASDLGILARHLAYDFPQYFPYFRARDSRFRGRVHFGHDNLLGRYPGADGIKTGYTNASGFNLVSSVVRSGAHVIGVVMGGYSARRRDLEMMRLLDWTFRTVNAATAPWSRAPKCRGRTWRKRLMPRRLWPASSSPWSGRASAATCSQYASVTPKGEIDEDAAESRSVDDEIAKLITNTPRPSRRCAQLAAQSQAPAPQQSQPQVRTPSAQPQSPTASPQQSQPQVRVPSAPPQRSSSIPPTSRPWPAAVKPGNDQRTGAGEVFGYPASGDLPARAYSGCASNSPGQCRAPVARVVSAAAIDSAGHAGAAQQRRRDNRPGSIKVTTAPGTTTAKLASAASTAVATHSWTIQIGAFNDVPTARAELAAYAEKSRQRSGTGRAHHRSVHRLGWQNHVSRTVWHVCRAGSPRHMHNADASGPQLFRIHAGALAQQHILRFIDLRSEIVGTAAIGMQYSASACDGLRGFLLRSLPASDRAHDMPLRASFRSWHADLSDAEDSSSAALLRQSAPRRRSRYASSSRAVSSSALPAS